LNALDPIVELVRADLELRRAQRDIDELHAAARDRLAVDPIRPWREALAGPGVSLIAEHKRRSPSAGPIREDLALEDVVQAYARAGAAALSILTEAHSFGGSLGDLRRAREQVELPLLRKDFIVDPYQLPETVAAGADAVLLIVAALDGDALRELYEGAVALGLGVLVEVHDAPELEVAASLGAPVIGVNNRDLTTLEVDLRRTLELAPLVPDGTVLVAESGFRTREELLALARAGVDAVLIGEALMRAPDVEDACRGLTGVV
jgi:indole-3-glycerol phosphate synthase